MMSHCHHAATLYVILTVTVFCLAEKLRLFQENVRIIDVTDTTTVRSLLECAKYFEDCKESASFNFNRETKACELSGNILEHSTTFSEGWKVYAKIVDGAWAEWTNWGSCSATCEGTVTRTRACTNPSPSNGGDSCLGLSSENKPCSDKTCLDLIRYFISTEKATWEDAKTACEDMAGNLLVIHNQTEQDLFNSLPPAIRLRHWIGLSCSTKSNCIWIDGISLEESFTNWAPGEPKTGGCVWMGYFVNKWDDSNCGGRRQYICEL